MAYRKKAEFILALQPDIVVVQECECPDKLIFPPEVQKPTNILWFGDNKHKGLGVFAYSHFKFEVLECYNEAFKMIVPILVKGGEFEFFLFAIWANNPGDADGQYVEQIWKAIHRYTDILLTQTCILIGDFNSNTIWDRKRRPGNHSSVVKFLADCSIHSTYHLHHKQEQGKEKHPTFYLYRNQSKPYHLDYCFLSDSLGKQVTSVEVGDFEYWIKYSDHVPLIITLGNNT